MSSLKDAPSLTQEKRKPFTPTTYDDDFDVDDDFIPPVASESEGWPSSKKRSKDKGKEKEKKSKKKKSRNSGDEHAYSSASTMQKGQTTDSSKKEMNASMSDDYADDFEKSVASDHFIPPVPGSPVGGNQLSTPRDTNLASRLADEEGRIAESVEAKLREERRSHERQIAEWQTEQAKREEEMRLKQEALESQIAALQEAKSQAPAVDEVVAKLVREQLAAASTQEVKQHALPEETEQNEMGPTGRPDTTQMTEAMKAELQRRRHRERERALNLRRAHEEEAAHSLFRRLAQDVREVFHELNLSVVAAEKERLIKDERYRKEREMKDRREDMERTEKLQKEIKEREEREAKFWSLVEQREERFQAFIESRVVKDEEEREERMRRELEDRATRTRNERELREELDRMDKERRSKDDNALRERDNSVLQSQLESMQLQYRAQVEEVRRQLELDRSHSEAMHRSELAAIEKRHEASVVQLQHQHAQQIVLMQSHIGNASQLEKVIESVHSEMESTKKMNETLTKERLQVLQHKERQLDEQRCLLDTMLEDVKFNRQEMEKERVRIAGLYAKFEIALSDFSKNAEEDRRHHREAQSHYDTLRQQLEKERRLLLTEVGQERKILEQQQEEFLQKKMEAMTELQTERMAISRERSEATLIRERQNRDETDLLKSLRAREEELGRKIESIEADRISVSELKTEQRRIYEEAVAEREALRKERQAFELEKNELLERFDELRRRAEGAAEMEHRLRKEVVEGRAAASKLGVEVTNQHQFQPGAYTDPMDVTGVGSRLQMDLARQRAVLQRMSS